MLSMFSQSPKNYGRKMGREDSHCIVSREQMHFCLVLIATSISIFRHKKKILPFVFFSDFISVNILIPTAVNHGKKIQLCEVCKDKIVYNA